MAVRRTRSASGLSSLLLMVAAAAADAGSAVASGRPRVIVTSDGEIDDECSLVRFVPYANE